MQRAGARRALRVPGILATALLATACASPSPGLVYATGQGATTEDGLRRLRWSRLGAEFVRPGAEFAGYQRVLVGPLTISERAEGARGDRRPGPGKQYLPTPRYLDMMEKIYRDTFARTFASGGFEVVAEPAPGVLQISAHVVDLVLTARLDPEQDVTLEEFVRTFGDVTVLLDVRDAESGDALLRTLDRQAISQNALTGAYRNTTGANISAQRDVFGRQALLLRDEIEKFRRMGAVPPPPR